MCTAFQCHGYFGRNLDLETNFQEQVVFTPTQYHFPLKNKTTFQNEYALLGMATVIDDYPLYAEAMNEKGLCMAGLYFPGNACYFEAKPDKLNITPFELIPFILGQYQNIEEVKQIINQLNLFNCSFHENLPLAPLHWIIADQKQSLILESTSEGLQVYEDSLHVLTNNPPYPYHQWNIRHYLHLQSSYPQDTLFHQSLKPFGNGFGTIGMPGDLSPASRFVKTLWLMDNVVMNTDEKDNVTQIFHILDSVAMVKGTVKTANDQDDYTIYSCCMSMQEKAYYYKTYENNQICCISMKTIDNHLHKLQLFPLQRQQNIRYL